MPTVNEWMNFFYPYLFDGGDLRYIPEADMAMAVAVAEAFRPACLTDDRQNQAQAHYAAYVAEYRAKVLAAGLSMNATGVVAGPIVEKREGDVSVKYATNATTSQAAIKDQLTGPGTPYAAWQALWEVCVPATVEGQLPVRRGAIMTGFG